MRQADERGANQYLKWRNAKKEFLIKFTSGSDSGAREELWTLLQKSYNDYDEIKNDKLVIDKRDEYREDEEDINVFVK